MRQVFVIGHEYEVFVTELKARVQSASVSAVRAVNRDLILLYWHIGRTIVERQKTFGWGESVIDRLSQDLRNAFPGTSGFSSRNLRSMRQFYSVYVSSSIWLQPVAKLDRVEDGSDPEIWQQLVAKIPWGHHLMILNQIDKPAPRLYYLRAAAQYGWSRNVLFNQIKAKAYERSLAENKSHNFSAALPEFIAEQAEEALKSSYNLEFLGISREVKERDLENQLIARLRDFILELGYGFCFVGRQHRLALGRKEYFIDLLFYHRFLKALVAIELKMGTFEPEHAGKMDFYLNLLNEKERGPDDRPSIGIILCAEKDDVEVEFALRSKTNPIGVAEYQLQPRLPAEFKGKLPTAKQLAEVIRKARPAKSSQ